MNHNKPNSVDKNDGVLIRKLFFIGIIVSMITGLSTLEGQRLKFYDQQLGTTLGIVLVIGTFSIIMGLLLKSLNKKTEKNPVTKPELLNGNKELSANEIIYYSLIENSGVVMYTTSINGYITFTSSKAFQLTGYSPEELIGMHFTQLIDADWMEEVVGKYQSQFKNNIEETLVEFCIRTKYGDLKW